MAQRLTTCPVCNSRWVRTAEILNPETTNMNARAKLQCENESCKHEWEGLVTSPYMERRRERGWIR